MPLVDSNESVQYSVLSDADSVSIALFEKVMAYGLEENLGAEPLGVAIQRVGQWFNKSPYVAGSLDQGEVERLVIKLDGFDCVTFVESTVALARTIQEGSGRFEVFVDKLTEQRYRNSVVEGYCSRLHYFSEWIYQNQEKGLVTDITREIGGIELDKQLNFMSEHRNSYPQLATNDSLFSELVQIEQSLLERQLYFVPQDQIKKVYPLLQEGDIIALATDIKGLDVVHTGFVYKGEDGTTGLLHSSTTHGVTVSPDLQEYVENNKRQIGILVARPKA